MYMLGNEPHYAYCMLGNGPHTACYEMGLMHNCTLHSSIGNMPHLCTIIKSMPIMKEKYF